MKKPLILTAMLSAILLTSCGPGIPVPIQLKEVKDTSMLTANCKAYIDDMRDLRDAPGNEPYKYHEISLNIEDSTKNYLDTGDVNGENRTKNSIPNRSDRNEGIKLEFEVRNSYLEDKEYTVLVSDNRDFNNAKEIKTTDTSVTVRNLFSNTEYYWKVAVDGNDESAVSHFTTGDYPRWITARSLTGEEGGRGIYNVRDMGGYMTYSGKRVKQGLVYRGGEITTMSGGGHYNTITEVAKKAFREDMGMVGGIELDLRGNSDISDNYKANGFAENGDIEYRQIAIKSYEETFTKDGSGQNNPTTARANVAEIFEILKNADQKPVYYHCFGGADRTGTVGFLLNGLLGVSYEDLVIDFELTSYSSIDNEHIRNHLEGHQHNYDRWPKLIQQIQTDTTGGYAWDGEALLKDNIENFLKKACGVPQETINKIREIMLED